jgi:hypothetical protein
MHQLFPGPDEDRFYGALLDARARYPKEWEEIVEYVC